MDVARLSAPEQAGEPSSPNRAGHTFEEVHRGMRNPLERGVHNE